MINFLLIPILIPFFMGMVLMFLQKNIRLQRILTLLTLFAAAFMAFLVMLKVQSDGIQSVTLETGQYLSGLRWLQMVCQHY